MASFFFMVGEPGYEKEFVNVVSEMERHFREKGWTNTRFELFFNQKKRYKAFPWTATRCASRTTIHTCWSTTG